MNDDAGSSKSRLVEKPWWLWLVVLLFPVVLRPWWVAIISIAAFVLFLRLILGPFPTKNRQ